MDNDDIVPIDDFSDETLRRLVGRLEGSDTFQAGLAREVELDEVWRRVEAEVYAARGRGAAADRVAALEALFQSVQEAHDLVGDGKPLAAADRLRQAIMRE